MRSALLASAAMLGLMLAHPGFAQSTMSDTQLRAPGQANPAPADMMAPTDPTVPAELQMAPHPSAVDQQGQPQPRQRGGELIDQSQIPLQEAQNQVPPSQVETMPGQPAAPKGQAANQEGQTPSTDAGTPENPAAPPGMPAYISPGQTGSMPGQPAAPHGQGEGSQGQATPDQRGDAQPVLSDTPILLAQNDTMSPQAKTTEGYNASGHEPMSMSASNTDAGNTRSTIAPQLPSPHIGPDASPSALLHAARDDLGRHQTGAAQEALERAETRLLDRSTEPGNASMPDSRDAVKLIGQARDALGHHDMSQAMQAIDAALQRPAVMQSASNM